MSFHDVVRFCRCGARIRLRNTRDIERKLYCSRRCRQLARYERGELDESLSRAIAASLTVDKRPIRTRFCEHCGRNYLPTSSRQQWCQICCPDSLSRIRLRRYGLSQPQYLELWQKQGGLCAVCRSRPPAVIDHDHTCCDGVETCGNCVRGLLCVRCNLLLGAVADDRNLLSNAAKYLEASSALQKS